MVNLKPFPVPLGAKWRNSIAARAALTLGAALLIVGTVSAQSTHPDLSGFWEPKYTGGSGAFIDVFGKVDPAPVVAGLPPMRRPRGEHPAYGAKDPVDGSACRVLAFPFFMTSSPPFDILQREDEILIIPEREGGSRHVYTDGRPHPADLEHTSNGHSIGHWEGDTLVIDRIFSGTGKRYPDITWIFSHAGGTMPFLIERFFQFGASAEVVPGTMTKGQGVAVSGTSMPGPDVLAQIRRYYYDTAQSSNPVAMEALKKVAHASQIVYGTDYWYRTAEETSRGLETGKIFNTEEMQAVNRGNVERIMPRFKRNR